MKFFSNFVMLATTVALCVSASGGLRAGQYYSGSDCQTGCGYQSSCSACCTAPVLLVGAAAIAVIAGVIFSDTDNQHSHAH